MREGRLDPAQKDAERAVALALDHGRTLTFADESGNEIETTALEQWKTALKARPQVRSFAEKSAQVERASQVHETEEQRKVREGFGYELGPNGEWIDPNLSKEE